jgi:tetratricopeptide (TPR) repeat protein
LLASTGFGLAKEAPDVRQLRDQLKKAEDAQDKPAIIELSRRIVAIAPNDSETWDTLAQTQLESEELDDLERTLDAWQKTFKRPPAAIEDFRAGLCFKRKDYERAEQHWLAFIATKPPRADVATDYDNLAEICAEQARWADHAAYRTNAIAAQDTAARRVLRAVAFLRLRNWDAAYADMAKANKMEATDPQVKEWLPEFERLQKFLPQIKALDAQIAKSANDPGLADLLLERARALILAERPLLAIDDAERAFKLQPASMRARIQLAEAFLDAGQVENAAKLEVDKYLRRGEDKLATASPSGGGHVSGHVSDEALRELGRLDARLTANPKDADALVARAKILRELRQFTLALADAKAALAIDDKSVAAHLEAAQNLDRLDRQNEALFQARTATELKPRDSNMWFFRGVLERQRADFSGAVASQTRSIEIDESLVALTEREQCERRIGKNAEADVDLRRIQELAPQKQ